MLLEGVVELDTMLSLESPKANMENDDLFGKPVSTKSADTCSDWFEKNFYSSLQETQDKAALKLQKVYKSFRIRRQLADCAVLAEQRWWKALDFAELKRSSISFFDIGKPETATSRWARARKRAAKVGKGLSEDTKARKLALQHWLEAIDPRHRYGHNLQFYYVKWLHCDSYQPFFYWLDVGDGKEVLSDRCSRTKLQQQCIKYLGPVERKHYEVVIENGRLFYKISGKPVQTTRDAKWIFVLSTSKTLYVGEKNKGTFQHSSFLAGGATLSAGRLVAENGVLEAIWPHSGHYLPTKENFEELMSFLKENNVDLTDVKKNPDEEDDFTKINQDLFRDNPSEAMEPLNIETEIANTLSKDQCDLRNEDSYADSNNQQPLSKLSVRFGSKIAKIEIPKRVTLYDIFGELANGPRTQYYSPTSESDGYETAEESFINESEFMVSKSNMFAEKQDEDVENTIPKEKILKRIDSHKARKSYQLANQLSTKWTTGAGPRIGCMRDYPLEIRNLILEQQNLSPKTRTTAPSLRIPPVSRFSPRVAFPPPLGHAPGA